MSLGKHKFYCEMCRKQCKDDNAFQQHKRSSQHQQNMLDFNQDPEFFINRFSKEVQETFLEVFKTKYGYDSFIPINKAYNEYIRDPYHTHLNSTRWANLAEFGDSLEEQGLVELMRETEPATGKEQVVIRLINKQAKSDKVVISKEDLREAERKREQKDLDKAIKEAHKIQVKLSSRGYTEEVKEPTNKGIFTFEVDSASKSAIAEPIIAEQIAKKEPVKLSLFQSSASSDLLSDLALLSKPSKLSTLDKIMQHQQKQSPQQPSWLRTHLIIKTKGPDKLKGEVVKLLSGDKVQVKLDNGQMKEFREGELGKVIPGEGGIVWLIKERKVGKINSIDMKTQVASVTCSDVNGKKDRYQVKLDELCKYNTNQ